MIRGEFLEDLLCYSRVTQAVIAEEVEQVGLDIGKMHDQAYDGGVSTTEKTNGAASLMPGNNQKAVQTIKQSNNQTCASILKGIQSDRAVSSMIPSVITVANFFNFTSKDKGSSEA